MQRFNVVVSKSDGGVELYPMKEWLRQNPDEIPPGLDATHSTSHQLRDGLKKVGWAIRETPTEIQLVKPGDRIAEVEEVLGPSREDEDSGTETEPSAMDFSLEYQLRDFIARNLGSMPVEGKRLRLYVDPSGRDGVEFPSSVGPIDILAKDDVDDFWVFELKRASSPDHAIGQLARYMGWVKQTIGRGRDVHGAIVAKSISDRLRYAVSVFPNVRLFEYEVEFHLKSAHELPLLHNA